MRGNDLLLVFALWALAYGSSSTRILRVRPRNSPQPQPPPSTPPPIMQAQPHADTHRDLPGHQLSRQAVLTIATNAGFPDPKLASAIAYAESGGVPGAIARSDRENSIGLWQINIRVHPYSETDMKDPIKNAHAAFQISKGGTDWQPWVAYTSGNYRKFLTGIFAP